VGARCNSLANALRQFVSFDDRKSLAILAGDYCLILGIAALAIRADNLLATVVGIALIAGRQVALLNLLHAAAHRALFSSSKLNDRVDVLVGYPLLDAVRSYRAFHLPHHRDIAGKSPDRFDYLYRQLPQPDAGAWRRTWTILLKPLAGNAGFNFLRDVWATARSDPGLAFRLASYWATLAVVFHQAGWLEYLLLYWLVPLIWLYPVFYFWAEIADHYAVRRDARNHRGLFYWLFLKAHDMCHAVHHRYPQIPFYRLRAANEHLASGGEQIEESSSFADFLRILYRRCPDSRPAKHWTVLP